MLQFTLDQKKAHDPGRHISITANAGSGKTRVLVGRYCDLVEGSIPGIRVLPDEIAAITFTEKAASELRARIAAELEMRLSDPDHKANWERLKRGRENFTGAIVSTIHGFCSAMLRAYPIETGVSPNFGITSGYERHQMLDDAVMEGIESAFEAKETSRKTYDVARRIGRERMEGILRTMVARREAIAMGRRSGVLTKEPEVLLATWGAELDAATRGILLNAETLPAIDLLLAPMKLDKREGIEGLIADLRRARHYTEILPATQALIAEVLTNTYGLRVKNYTTKDFATVSPEALEVVTAAARAAKNFAEASVDPQLHALLIADTRTLLGIYDGIMVRYEASKHRANVLDFEDLQLRLLDALAPDSAATEAIAQRFRYLMVDEFQDTNELQWALAFALTRELSGAHLCIVGDRKQSIYGFRNADVEVFYRATETMKRTNRDLGYSAHPLLFRNEELPANSRDEELGEVNLSASFRLLPSICAFVNDACAPILRDSPRRGASVEYEPLVVARRSEGRGSVEIILATPEPDKLPEDSGTGQIGEQSANLGEPPCDIEWCSQEDMIARRIAAMVATGESIWEVPEGEEAEQQRPVRFGDIAILCRKRSFFAGIEDAFRRYGIPWITWGGSGFYSTQEVYDVLHYLRTLVSTRDDVAVLGVFRAPWFAVSDDELYRLSIDKDAIGLDLWSRAERRVASGDAAPALVRAVETISDDRHTAGRISIPLLIRRIVERTGWRGAVIGRSSGEQIMANIEKLLEMAREFEERGFTSLNDFVQRLTELVDLDDIEGEAPVNTGRDAVRLMTIHASKGLEFPVVVIPSLHSPPRSSHSPYFDRDLGFGWNWGYDKSEQRPAVVALMEMRANDRDRAEEARLFYVAITRARDRMILSGVCKNSIPRGGTMLAWALAPFEYIPDTNAQLELITPALRFLDTDGSSEYDMEWQQSIAFHTSVEDIPAYNIDDVEQLPFREGLVRVGDLPAEASGEIYSATQYAVHSHCPTRYYLRYRLGIPEKIADAWNIDSDDRDTDDGTIFSRLFRHAVLRIDTIAANPDSLQAILDEILRLEPLTTEERAAMSVRLRSTILGLLQEPVSHDLLLPGAGDVAVDYELRMPVGREYLMGVVDRMMRTADGGVRFIQYKTRRIDSGDLRRAAASYTPQMQVYAWLLARRFGPNVPLLGTILFTEHPELPQSATFTQIDLARIERDITLAINDIRGITYGGHRSLPTLTPHCPDCPYWIERVCLLAK